QQVGFKRAAVRAGFRETGRDDHDGLDALLNAVVYDTGKSTGRYRDHHEIEIAGDIRHARNGRYAVDVLRRGMHRGDTPGESGLEHVVQNLRTDLAALATGAHDGDGPRFEEALHRRGGGGLRSRGRAILVH